MWKNFNPLMILRRLIRMETRFLSLLGVLVLLLAVPTALANGEGQVLSYKPNVVSVGDGVTLEIELINDALDDTCIDEILIMPPDSWTGTADVTKYDRSTYTDTREESNDDKYLVGDSQSSRIVPTHSLCPGETVNIKVEGLNAPNSPQVSDIVIKTSDQTHNSPPSEVYDTIDSLIPGKAFALPKVYVTTATEIKLKYFRITSFSNTGFDGRSWGAWARPKKLYLSATAPGSLKIEVETGTTDEVIFNGAVVAGVNTIALDYSGWNVLSNDADIKNGYLRDQAGARDYYITLGGGGSLTLLGSEDEILDDEDLVASGLVGARGTIITAGTPEQRKVLVQIVDGNGFDVMEVIPLEAEVDPALDLNEVPPFTTDSRGEAFFTIQPECDYGVFELKILTDPLKTTPYVIEKIGVNAGSPASYAVTEGKNAKVPAHGDQLIEVTVYDSCGNKVSNTDQVLVKFDYETMTCGSQDKLADVPLGTQNDHHEEKTDMGVADAYLITDCQICTHEVQISGDWPVGTGELIQLFGINGPPAKMKVTIVEDEIQADECVEALIEVVDECGNLVAEIPSEVGDEMEEWESIVRVTIRDSLKVDQPGWASSSFTYIDNHDFREGEIHNYFPNPFAQGKLNQGVGHVIICGCMGLGTFDVVAESDTIEPGNDTVSVINADPDCIEVDTIDQLLLCEREAEINVSIKDVCGNFWRNQGCGTGEANYCVDFEVPASGSSCTEDDAHLSTNSVCIPVGHGDPGYLQQNITLYRDTDDCCQLNLEASRGTGCCGDYPELGQCEVVDVLFHGGPSFMRTEFFRTRKLCEGDPECYEQLHEPIQNGGYEVVSEEVLDLFTVFDQCGHIVKDYNGTIDVLKENEDCASIYQVDHPLVLEGEPGWCTGSVLCEELTPFGEFKCVEEADGCKWNPKGECSGEPVCSEMLWKAQCQNWGCEWIGGAFTGPGQLCEMDDDGPDYMCEDPNAPGKGTNKEVCEEVGCTWNDTSECAGGETPCNGFIKDQCVAISEAAPGTCEWMTNCNEEFENTIIKKLVIHNCAPETEKKWLPLEVEDIMVDKLAFYIDHEIDPSLWVYVYMENEIKPGLQPGDFLIGKAPLVFGGPTIIEIADAPFWRSSPFIWDDQREGGVLIRAGDSRDFYIMLVKQPPIPGTPSIIPCGTYSAQFLYYQDYTGPDYTEWGCGHPDPDYNGIIDVDHCNVMDIARDGCLNSDNFNWINFRGPAPHPVCPYTGPGVWNPNLRRDSRNDDYGHSTPDYGFGDVYLNDLPFKEGQAWTKQRDLTAETVYDWVVEVNSSGYVCDYSDFEIEIRDQPEVINFVAQPATQIELINHDKHEEKIVSCNGWDEEVNAYLFNIQVTDGFENPVHKEIEVELEYCLKLPVSKKIEQMVRHWCRYEGCNFGFCDIEECEKAWMDIDHCFTKEDLKNFIKDTEFGQYMGEVLFGDYFGDEFNEWLDAMFEDAKVEFWNTSKGLLPYDAHGHQVVMTNEFGEAQVYVTANKAGGYKIIARPLALDGATAFVWFNPGAPDRLDLMALPSFGVPADGEEEALLLLRALDECGNLVEDHIHDITVEVVQGEQVYISQDFDGKNNYDGDVEGTLWCNWYLGFTKLAVLSDLPQNAVLMASSGELDPDTTEIAFQGAPVKLAITAIEPSDRLPADGMTGAWVTVQVQDKNGNRVTGYKGKGYSGDPGDPWGKTDFLFENICFDLDEARADFPIEMGTEIYPWQMDIDAQTFGWVNWRYLGPSMYCGDLLFGEGSVYVTLDNEECEHGGAIQVKVWDALPLQGQEFDENGIPVSDHATQLDPDMGEIDFVDPATKWNIWADKQVVLADGETYTLVTIQVENEYMDVRQAVEANVFVGGTADSGATIAWISNYEGQEAPDPADPDNELVWDHLNPTSVRAVTSPITGRAYLLLKSTEPGIAEVTVTGGQAYVCHKSRHIHYQCTADNSCEKVYKFRNCHYSKKNDLDPGVTLLEFLEVASNEIYLDKGWNFISTPFALVTPGLKNMMDAQAIPTAGVVATAWDDSSQAWTGDINTVQLTPLNGVWVYMPNSAVLTLTYQAAGVATPPDKTVYKGWNTVGLTWNSPYIVEFALKSIDNSYTNFIQWDKLTQKYGFPIANTDGDGPLETGGVSMYPKDGYWIWVTATTDTLAGLTANV
jgi:hypothetical protein